jgi:hypothetical protein
MILMGPAISLREKCWPAFTLRPYMLVPDHMIYFEYNRVCVKHFE